MRASYCQAFQFLQCHKSRLLLNSSGFQYWRWLIQFFQNTRTPQYQGSKITADGDCSHEIKRRLLLGRKAMTNLGSMLKYRDVTLSTKVGLVKAVVFPVVMYGCESWTIKKVEHWRIGAFELWCWRRLLGVPWTARRPNQSILKEISSEYSLEGLMLKLKLQYFGHLMQRTHWKRPWCQERLKSGGEGNYRGWDGWMASPTQWTWIWVDSGSWWWTRRPGVLQSMGLQRVRHDWATELNWTVMHSIFSSYAKPWASLGCYWSKSP